MPRADLIIVGAGAAGLSAAGALKRRGIDAVILEQDSHLGGTWQRRYDRLHLHTVRAHSGLAHYPMPRSIARYPSRDEYAAYLNDYARHFGLNVVTDFRVQKVRTASIAPVTWEIVGASDTWQSRAVVLATGQYGVPRMPLLPGQQDYGGEFTHSVNYRNAAAYAGKHVLIVGAGNSGAEIATDLAEHGAAFVAISIRTAPPIVPRDPFGNPVQRTSFLLSLLPPRLADRIARLTARLTLGDLSRYGMPAVDWQPYSSRRVPVIDVGFVDALKRGLVRIRPALARLTSTGAIYADAHAEPFDAIIAATGFSSGLDALLENTAVLDETAEPIAPSGEPTTSPGMFFVGYTHSLRGHLFEANRASRRLAANVASYLEQAGGKIS